MKKILWVAASIGISIGINLAYATDNHVKHWGYTGHEAAQYWGDIQSDFATCKLGNEQSPIDIKNAIQSPDLPPIDFKYMPGDAEVVNNGHTIQVNLPAGGEIKLASGAYKLVQFHFHTPSEERVNGLAYPLVAHLVHRNDKGNLAVVAVLFKYGKANPILGRIFAVMPKNAKEKANLLTSFNPNGLLPAKQTYFSFKGSLTTPPCSEGVQWQVLKEPVELSKDQLSQFKKLYSMNARPVQALNGRKVQVSTN